MHTVALIFICCRCLKYVLYRDNLLDICWRVTCRVCPQLQCSRLLYKNLRHSWLPYVTFALSILVDHRPQATCLYPVLSCAAASILLQLQLFWLLSAELFSRCSLIAVFLCSLAVSSLSTLMLVWQCYVISFAQCAPIPVPFSYS